MPGSDLSREIAEAVRAYHPEVRGIIRNANRVRDIASELLYGPRASCASERRRSRASDAFQAVRRLQGHPDYRTRVPGQISAMQPARGQASRKEQVVPNKRRSSLIP